MIDIFESEPVLLCGREFSFQELKDIQETIRMFSSLSRKELALTICEKNGFPPTDAIKSKLAGNS